MPKLSVVIASTRPGRVGEPVARWFIDHARAHGGFELDWVDLRELGLPIMDEPNHPRLAQYTKPHTRAWSQRVQATDAFALVTPEYNYGPAPALINAIDYLNREWQYKPVGFVSYGGVSGGTRAVQVTKQIVTTLKMVAIPEAVSIPFVGQFIEGGSFVPNEQLETGANAMLDELRRWVEALAPLRATVAPVY